jgi:hypothetical protein
MSGDGCPVDWVDPQDFLVVMPPDPVLEVYEFYNPLQFV